MEPRTHQVATNINGADRTLSVGERESTVEVLRDQLGLTGTKLVCGGGVCGACTILVDGVAMNSCLLPATALHGRKVQTIEAHDAGGLHPVQRAFMANDALQCGFCTPGFVNEAIAFYARWRAERGKTRPSREEIAAAMAGHLCRCGAYVGIYAAVGDACEGKYDDVAAALSAPRVESRAKVTGSAKYTVDVHLDEQLEGVLLRSPLAAAKVGPIDLAAITDLPGVRAAVELLEEPRVVRYVGQPILAIAAATRHEAEAALDRIELEFTALPAVFDPDAALAAGAPEVYPEKKKKVPTAAEGVDIPAKWSGNLRTFRLQLMHKHPKNARKVLDAAKSKTPERYVGRTYQTSAQIHTALEPHACVAHWPTPDTLDVHLSTQACWQMGQHFAEHFELEPDNVHVRSEHVGGAFGAKQEMTAESRAAIELSRKAGVPVRVVLDRLEEMVDGGYRPPERIALEVAANEKNELAAVGGVSHGHAGIAANSMVMMLLNAVYPCSARGLDAHDVVTNLPPGKPFRGPGGPPACFAIEQAVDEMAHKLGVDPIELRRRWDDHEMRHKLYDWAAALPIWRERATLPGTGRIRRGVGIAMGNWMNMYLSKTKVEVSATRAGLTVRSSIQDMGNGARSVLAHTVARVFSLSPDDVVVGIGDSHGPRGGSSSGSTTTNSIYHPALTAASKVKEKLEVAAQRRLGLVDAKLEGQTLRHAGGTISWEDLLERTGPVTETITRGTNGAFDVVGAATTAILGMTMGKGNTGAVYVVEVEVDTRFGRTRVRRVWGGISAGKIVVPELAHSQVYGGIIQGLGLALYEERRIDPKTGHVLTYNLEDYRIPGIGDAPEITLHFLEEGFEGNKGGAVGLSELATMPMAAATANAVFHATGHRPTELPIRPEDLLANAVLPENLLENGAAQ